MATRRTTGSARAAAAAPPAGEKAATPRRRTAAGQPATASGASTRITVSADARRAMIEQAAYLRAERRGFTAGGEVEDWLAAEVEVDALLRAGDGGPPQ
ncbi:MAG TPA: DUF2934 domain-containing protein [Steroidobacteraceae bacterium]